MAKKYHGFGKVKNDKANMPQEVVHKSYPKGSYVSQEGYYRDDISGIDMFAEKTKSKLRKNMKKGM